jgi:hypothetical protein
MSNILKKCPSCGNDLIISELSCENCGIKIKGNFSADSFSGLSAEECDFIKQFILSDGNISKMQAYYGETYMSIKGRLNSIKIKLDGGLMINDMSESLTNNQDGKVIRRLKEKIIEYGGKAAMPVLKGTPIAFWVSSTQRGFETDGLKGFVLEWEVFDSIVKEAVRLGGKMYRGDVAAQSGAKIGSVDLPLTTIEAYIAVNFYGASIGSTTTRRSTYFTGILAWAGIVQLYRSQGQGSFIVVNPEYRDMEE